MVLLKTYVEYSIRNVKFLKNSKLNMFINAACVLFLIKQRWPKNKSLNVKAIFLLMAPLKSHKPT